MPLGPKYALSNERPRASRQFTDREELIETFERAVSSFPFEDYKVLTYFGVGGIGKTSLRKELGRLLDEQHTQVAWAVLDFETRTHRDVESGLSWLSKELRRLPAKCELFGVEPRGFEPLTSAVQRRRSPD
jgi:hypothetical protein